MAGSCGSRVSVVGNRIQLFAEDDREGAGGGGVGSGGGIAGIGVGGGGGGVIEEAQDLLSYRKTDSTRLQFIYLQEPQKHSKNPKSRYILPYFKI